MGCSCSKASSSTEEARSGQEGGAVGAMFRRIDKEGKGYLDLHNLEVLMRDDKTYFQGRDASHIIEKYGVDGKMNFDQFKVWWNSTYTTYNDDALMRMVQDAQSDIAADSIHLDTIPELPRVPHNSNVAISRS
jgi:Ca2+-binding EF-hand superfamily protein